MPTNAWSALVTYQPWLARDTETVGRLRAINCDLHHVFAEAAVRASRGETMPAASIEEVRAVARRVRDGTATTHVDRRALQHRLFLLGEAFDAGAAGTAPERREADLSWPDVASTQRLAYYTLSLCWRMERGETVAGDLDRLDVERRQLPMPVG
jgi:hypothetical protein